MCCCCFEFGVEIFDIVLVYLVFCYWVVVLNGIVENEVCLVYVVCVVSEV